MSDRGFTIAFSISLGLHLFLLIAQFISWQWGTPRHLRRAVEIIYDYEVAKQEVRQLQEQLARAKREATAIPTALNSDLRTQIRIPERPSLAATRHLGEAMLAHTAFVDLANLTEASGGDPVRLAYFSAIREQIERAARRRTWVTGEETAGLVYVVFVLQPGGSLQKLAILKGRSVESPTLQDTALQILEDAAPFPPFPPSIRDASQTIVIPLEFLLGS